MPVVPREKRPDLGRNFTLSGELPWSGRTWTLCSFDLESRSRPCPRAPRTRSRLDEYRPRDGRSVPLPHLRERSRRRRLRARDPGDPQPRRHAARARPARLVLRRRQRQRQVDARRGDRGREQAERRGRRRVQSFQVRDDARRSRGSTRRSSSSARSAKPRERVLPPRRELLQLRDAADADAGPIDAASTIVRCTSSRTASRSSRSCSNASGRTASTSSTSRRPRCRLSASSR